MGTDYFRLHPWIGVLSNLPVLAGAAALLLALNPWFQRRLERHPALWIGGAFVLTRIVFLILIVVQMRHVSLDLGTNFETQGWAVLRGHVPYRDFGSSYAPLFAYLMAIPSLIRGPLPFFVFFAVCDLVALVLVMTAARREASPGPLAARAGAARAGWIYAVAPVTWYFLVRYGQDEALAAAILVGAYVLQKTGRETAAAALLAFGFAATKFTFGLFLPPFVIAARRPLRFGLVLMGVVVLLFAPFLATGVPVWRPLTLESGGMGFGPSIWRLPIVFTPFVAGWPVTLILVVSLLILWAVPPLTGKRLDLERHLLLTGALFLILSPKVLPMYATPFWPFASLWLARTDTRCNLVPAAFLNLVLGTWWYFDAGGINGMFGPLVQVLAAMVTAAVPLTLVLIAFRLWRETDRTVSAHV